jgi:hypothetical protein
MFEQELLIHDIFGLVAIVGAFGPSQGRLCMRFL